MHLENGIKCYLKASKNPVFLYFYAGLWYNSSMEKDVMTREYLEKLPPEALVTICLQNMEMLRALSAQFSILQKQNEEYLKKIDTLQENMAVLIQQRFGRKTEKFPVNQNQLSLDLGDVLNEAEKLTEDGIEEEPEDVITVKRKKTKGKRAQDLSKLEKAEPEYHEMSEEELQNRFPNGYTRLADDVYYEVEYIRARCVLHEHHVAVYAGNRKEGIARAEKPERLLKNSIATPSLAAAVINSKYVNAIPLNRISQELARYDLNLSRQVLAGWMIRLPEQYLQWIVKEMWKELKKSRLIHCDETPFKVTEDSGDHSYMWVYHAGGLQGSKPVFIYEYDPGRSTRVLETSLADYNGIVMTDGYQVYHTYEKKRNGELKVAGCWAHARRKFAELVKSLDAKEAKAMIAADAVKKIQAIYHVDNMMKDASPEVRLKHRQDSVKPLVDAYFAWIDTPDLILGMDKGSPLYKAIQYSRNQEQFLRAFLTDGNIPLDNNDAERSIRSFCIGKHNWRISDTKAGAKASGILYSIAETAKANGLKPFEYFTYVLEQFLLHAHDEISSYISDLVPWSERIPDRCRKMNN